MIPTPAPGRFPRAPRLNVRGVMVLVALVALPAGWAANTIQEQRRAVAAVRAAGGRVTFDWQREAVGWVPLHPVMRDEPAAPRWLRRWLGDELFQAVVAVDYAWGPFDPAALVPFDRLEWLNVADLDQPAVDWRPIAGLRRLDHLRSRGAWLTDEALAAVGRAGSLRGLWVEEASATAPGFARLDGLANLESLWLIDCPGLTDAAVARLVARLSRLRMLWVGGCPGASATLEALARRPAAPLDLTLDRCRVGDADLAAVARIAGLRRLDLGDAPITDLGLARLAHLTGLESFRTASPAVTDLGLAHLARLARLNDLEISQSPALTDAGLAHLHGLASLNNLDLGHDRFTPEAVADLRAAIIPMVRVNTAPAAAMPPWPSWPPLETREATP